MLLAPLVGLGLGLLAAAVVLAARQLFGASAEARLLAGLAAVAIFAWATRGLHLDGLADTADGLGSGREPDGALAVMRRSDIGPFGVVVVALVMAVQVVAVAACVRHGRGTEGLILAGAVSRTAVVMGTARGVPPARPDGLGAMVAESVPAGAWVLWGVATAVLAGAYGWMDEGAGPVGACRAVVAVVAGLAAARLFLGRCVRRLGGVTGDVLGALVEVSAAVTLVVVATVVPR